MTPHVINALQVRDYFASLGVPSMEFEARDATYACIDRRFMLGDFYDSVRALLWDLDLTEWEEDWDCDDFTKTYVWWAHVSHRKAQRAAGQFWAEGEAVFECWIRGLGHAIAVCIEHVGDGDLNHFFVEPQPQAQSRELIVAPNLYNSISLIQ